MLMARPKKVSPLLVEDMKYVNCSKTRPLEDKFKFENFQASLCLADRVPVLQAFYTLMESHFESAA